MLLLKSKLFQLFIIAVMLIASYGYVYHKGSEHKEQQMMAEQAKADKAQQAKYDILAEKYEGKKIEMVENVRTITKTVEKLVDRPVYRNVCIDDSGMHLINQALSGERASKLADEMPKIK